MLHRNRLLALTVALLLAGGTAACAGGPTGGAVPGVLRLGVFPNITHAPGLIGIERGLIAAALGDEVALETFYFNAGGEAVEALFSKAIDITYIGPNPAINGFQQSECGASDSLIEIPRFLTQFMGCSRGGSCGCSLSVLPVLF